MSYKIIGVGPDKEGKFCPVKIHLLHKETLDLAKTRVKVKNWDYVAIIAGLPGSGKSTLARVCAKYCSPSFNLNYVAFTADEFVKITNECEEFASVILDESFASLNSRTTMTPDFLKVINHLQIIRQKHLFIFLCLPNFFDLAKGIAIFRASHLFVTYPSESGDRGPFLAFDRDSKRKLFVKGMKYMDYNCVKANFIGDFWKNEAIIDEEEYEKMKKQHLLAQEKDAEVKIEGNYKRDHVIYRLHKEFGFKPQILSDLFKLSVSQTYEVIRNQEKMSKNIVK